MRVHGLDLPAEFVECLRSGALEREVGCWELSDTDSYGNKLECDVGELYGTEEAIRQAAAELPEHFSPDGVYGEESEWKEEPGFLPDIVDFTRIVPFGASGDGAPFCFDYRDSEGTSVIWWDDVYWRRISPSFDEFLKLVKR